MTIAAGDPFLDEWPNLAADGEFRGGSADALPASA